MDSKNNKRILFIRLSQSSFIQSDLRLLRKYFNVKEVDFILNRKDPKSSIKTVFSMIMGILWADLTFSWFADIHAYWAVKLSKLFKKKSIVVVGGYEVANAPEMNYGLMRDPKYKSYVIYTLNNANKIFAVSKFTKKEIMKYNKSKNVDVVYNGVDYHKFKLLGATKEDIVITVSSVEEKTYKLKGLDTFIKVSNYFPEFKFVIIGNCDSKFYDKLDVPANVIFTGALPQEDVVSWFNKSKVYCQLSYRESFGMALAESMCCECVPVITDSTALPEIVYDAGFYVKYGDVENTVESIKRAIRSDIGEDARKRIIEKFPISNREIILVEKIRDVVVS